MTMENFALRTKNVAGSIRKLREYKDYTQDYLAAKLKISQNAYSKIELGYSKLSLERFFQIAFILDINPSKLITLNDADLIEAITTNNIAH